MSRSMLSLRGVLDRLAKPYFDHLYERLTDGAKTDGAGLLASLQASMQAEREALQRELDDTRGAVMANIDETRGTVLRNIDETRGTVMRNIDETRGTVMRNIDESRGAVSLNIDQSRAAVQEKIDLAYSNIDESRALLQKEMDELNGHVGRFRHAFDNFQAAVEPRVVAVEQRLDAVELRLLTMESEQKDYDKARSRDMATVAREAGALRDDVLRDIGEQTRMLLMQGDASDQVAEALGRTIARLSAELEHLTDLLAAAPAGQRRLEAERQPV